MQTNLDWNMKKDAAYNCKIQITAVDGLKGKINVEINKISGVDVQIYGYPKYINPGYMNTGILENGMYFYKV
jgi:hypothetical protein